MEEKAKVLGGDEWWDEPSGASTKTSRKTDLHKEFHHLAINTPDSEIHHFAEPFSTKKVGPERFRVDTVLQGLRTACNRLAV